MRVGVKVEVSRPTEDCRYRGEGGGHSLHLQKIYSSTRIAALTCTSEFGITRIRRCVLAWSSAQIFFADPTEPQSPPPTLPRHVIRANSLFRAVRVIPSERTTIASSQASEGSSRVLISVPRQGSAGPVPGRGRAGKRRASNLGCFRICVRVQGEISV